MTMTGEEIYRNFTEGSTVTLDCAGKDVTALAAVYKEVSSGLNHAQRLMMAAWTGGAALPAWAAATELANAIELSAERLDSYGAAHTKQAAAFESARSRVVVVPPEPAGLNPFETFAEVFKTGNPAAPFTKINEYHAAVDAHDAANELNRNVMLDYESATNGHTIPDNYPPMPVGGDPNNTIDNKSEGGKEPEDEGETGGGGGREGGGTGGGAVPVARSGSAGGFGSTGGSGEFGIGDVGAGAGEPGDVDLGDLPPSPDADPGQTDPSRVPTVPTEPTYHPPGPNGTPPTGDPPKPPPTGWPPGPGGTGGSSGSGTQAARANAGRTGQLDGSDLPGAFPWAAGGGDPSGESARGGAGQGAARSTGGGAGAPGTAGAWRANPAGGLRGAGGPGAFGGAPVSGRKEEDDEHTRPDYLIEPDPDALFGSDERASAPVIGESWKPE